MGDGAFASSAASTQPCVSVITIVYNGQDFLREAIESVLGQSLADWELIVVDDGSSDQSAAIVHAYMARHPTRIQLISHADGKNHGMSAARNLGVARARGRYVGFLDADDVWLPDKLGEQVAILDADRGLGLVYGRTLIWHSWSPNAAQDDFFYPLGVRPNCRYGPPCLYQLLLENRAQTPTTCNALIRSDLLTRIGGFEVRFTGMFEDQTFFARALAQAPAYVSDRTWAKYRQHPASCSARSAAAGRDQQQRVAFLKWLRGTAVHRQAGLRARWTMWKTLAAAERAARRRPPRRATEER